MESTAAEIPHILYNYPAELKNGAYDLNKLLGEAKGVAFLQVYRLGCIVTVRGSRGLLFAKTETGHWSAPSAVHFGGIALGADIGLERSEFMVIIKSKDALEAFGQNALQVGLNGCLALGPFGRSGEVAIGSAGDVLIISRSIGIYGGVSLEFSGLLHDNAKNSVMYSTNDTRAILAGTVKRPEGSIWDKCFQSLEENTRVPAPAGTPIAAVPVLEAAAPASAAAPFEIQTPAPVSAAA